jgi:hypothetical protein
LELLGNIHSFNFKGFQLAVPETVDPGNRRKGEMNHQIEDIVTVDLGAISMVLLASGQLLAASKT